MYQFSVSAWISWKSLENYTQNITTEFFWASQIQSFMYFLLIKVEMCKSKIKIKLIIDKVHIFWEKSPINVKWNLEIRHIFVAFSEYMNFTNSKLICHFLFTALVSKLDFLFAVYVVYILVYIPQWFLSLLSNPH